MASVQRIKNLPVIAPRAKEAHKGSFGRVLIIGGSVGMSGAPALAGLAALRSGAGLVTIAVPEPVLPMVAGVCPCATTIPLPSNAAGQIKPAGAAKLLRKRGLIGANKSDGAPDAVVIGPGLGSGSAEYAVRMWALIDEIRPASPMVIDADALNLAALLNGTEYAWDQRTHAGTIITPHPGELARWLGAGTKQVQAAREQVATDTAWRMGMDAGPDELPVVVLKGAGTIVTDSRRVYANTTGNPGMATGGSGDVLCGVIAALVGQGLSRFDAAVAGVFIHGLAGDLAADEFGQVSMVATDIIDFLPGALVRYQTRTRRAKRSGPT